MCVARLVMQQWRDEMKEILKKSEMKELLNKIYVDDNRAIIQKLKHGVRFNESKKIFEYDSRWEKEDESLSIEELTVREVLKAMNNINSDLRFTVETENDFDNKRLPTLSFEIWSCKEGI